MKAGWLQIIERISGIFLKNFGNIKTVKVGRDCNRECPRSILRTEGWEISRKHSIYGFQGCVIGRTFISYAWACGEVQFMQSCTCFYSSVWVLQNKLLIEILWFLMDKIKGLLTSEIFGYNVAIYERFLQSVYGENEGNCKTWLQK